MKTGADQQLTLTLTVSAARRRWGGWRVPFCAGRAAGRALTLAVAQRAICVRGSPAGSRGMCPRSTCGLCPNHRFDDFSSGGLTQDVR